MKRSIISLTLLASCFSEDDSIGFGLSSSSSSSESSSSTGIVTTIATTIATTDSPDAGTDEVSSSSESTGVSGSGTDEGSSSSESTGEPVTDWAIYFDGTNSATSTTELDLTLGNEFTVEGWVRFDSADARGTIASFLGVGTSGWSLGLDEASNLSFALYDNNGALHEVVGENASELSPGWTHVAAIKSGSSLYLYVAGDLDQTSPSAVTSSSPTVALALGVGSIHGEGQYFVLDDLRISSGRRYQVNFDPEHDLSVDVDARLRAPFDEADGTVATCDGSLGATFALVEPVWIEGDTPE